MPGTVRLLSPRLALLKLPDEIPDPALHYQSMPVNSRGDEEDILVAYERYKLWKPPEESRVRWAQISWPDDGLGLCGHGAARTIVDAVLDCYKHKCKREEAAAAL